MVERAESRYRSAVHVLTNSAELSFWASGQESFRRNERTSPQMEECDSQGRPSAVISIDVVQAVPSGGLLKVMGAGVRLRSIQGSHSVHAHFTRRHIRSRLWLRTTRRLAHFGNHAQGLANSDGGRRGLGAFVPMELYPSGAWREP